MAEKKILVITDDGGLAYVMKHIFGKIYEFIRIFPRSNIVDKIKEIGFDPDLIIIDLMMPCLENGIGIALEIKTNHDYGNIPILLLSVWKMEDYGIRSFDLNSEGCLGPPMTKEELKEKVSFAISKARR